jgi:hypothetical protein
LWLLAVALVVQKLAVVVEQADSGLPHLSA